jgi:hypothetical protein
MNHYPFFDNLNASIVRNIDAKADDFKLKFSGAMPFVRFTNYNDDIVTIGTNSSYAYSNAGAQRFPPLIQNLEIKPGGSMGVLRQGIVSVKFASMGQMQLYGNFFRIGTPKSIIWGWSKNRTTGDEYSPPQFLGTTEAKKYVDDINAWKSYCAGGGYSYDTMVGPLMDFTFSVNADATIDATFTIGTKNEIPAFLGTTRHDKTMTVGSNKEQSLDAKLARTLELTDNEFLSKTQIKYFEQHSVNFTYANKGVLYKLGTDIYDYVASEYDAYTEDIFIDLETIADLKVNKQKTDTDYIFDISKAIASGHPNMISNSENVFFPNATMAYPEIIGNKSGTALRLNTSKTQNASKPGKQYPEQVGGSYSVNPSINKYEAGRWGYVKNIFLRVDFVLDVAKSVDENGTVGEFVQKLCDEINKAACGLMELNPQVTSNGDKTIYSIVDYALIPTEVTATSTIDLFNPNTTITNITFNCDLPKEIAAMAMLGKNQKSKEIGENLFFEYETDPTDILNVENRAQKRYNAKIQRLLNQYNGGKLPPGFGGVGGLPAGNASGTSKPKEKNWFQKLTDYLAKNYTPVSGPGFTPLVTAALTGSPKDDKLIDENVIIFRGSSETGYDYKEDIRGIVKDTALVKNLYFGSDGHPKNNPLLPIEIELKVLGISGITIGTMVNISPLPFFKKGLFQVTEVSHSVQDNWETTIKFRFRPDND